MGWILDAFSGGADDNDDDSGGSGDERNVSSKMAAHEQGTLQSDLSELKQSFSKHLMGVASFLAGDDIAASSSSDSAAGAKQSSMDGKDSARHDGDAAEVAPLLGPKSSLKDIGSVEGRPSSLDEDSEFHTVNMAGVKSDLAEFKETVTSGLSHFSAVLGLVAGDDLLPSLDKGKGKLSEGQVSEHRDAATGSGAGYSQEQRDGSIRSAFALASGIGSGIGNISKLASDFLAFNVENLEDEDGEHDGDLGSAVGLTEEVLAFANNVAAHPETWLDFPLPEMDTDKDFELSEAQEGHVRALEFHSARLVALRMELCPAYMSEERFWKIYFVLLHSRLHPDDAALLSTPQIVMARRQVLENLRKRSARAVVDAEEDDEQESEAVPGSPPPTVERADSLPAETPAPATDEKPSPELHADKKELPPQTETSEKTVEAAVSFEASGAYATEKLVPEDASASVVVSAPAQSVSPPPAVEVTAEATGVAVAEKVEPAATKPVQTVAAEATGKSAEAVEKVTAGEDEEVDDWLDDSGERGGSEVDADEEEEDVSFSDLEDEDEEEEGKNEGGEKGSGASTGKGTLGWIQLGRTEKGETGADDEDSMSSSPSIQGSRDRKGGSPSGDSTEWLKVSAPEETMGQH